MRSKSRTGFTEKRRQYSNLRRKNPMHEQGECLFRGSGIFIATAWSRDRRSTMAARPLCYTVHERADGLDRDRNLVPRPQRKVVRRNDTGAR